jgi:hypothetical protein
MNRFKIGDRVRVYRLMNPRDHLLGVSVIKNIAPMHNNGEDMLWLDGIIGAWHPDACELDNFKNLDSEE